MAEEEKKTNDISKVKTVKQMLKWKKLEHSKEVKTKDVETINIEITKEFKWAHPDVLYSFLGIYALGVYAYNDKNLFNVTECLIIQNGTNIRIYNLDYLLRIQSDNQYKLKELNEDIKPFIERYSKVGNVFPMWPGGNKARGNANNGCFDIPERYFAIEYNWFLALRRIYKDTIHFDGYINRGTPKLARYKSLNSFLKTIDTPEKYKEFIDSICKTIDNRSEELEEEYAWRKRMKLLMNSQIR